MSKRKVIILSGVPGAGKSTGATLHVGAIVCSADHTFTDADGVYHFDPARLPEAHARCLQRFVWAIQRDEALVIVDNTNTTAVEIAPYAALALAYGYELEIVTMTCDPAVAAARNVHGVPLDAIAAMAARIEARELPPWWPHTLVQG